MQCRRLARSITDERAVAALLAMAIDYDDQAQALARG
jgi:hypothetical protein